MSNRQEPSVSRQQTAGTHGAGSAGNGEIPQKTPLSGRMWFRILIGVSLPLLFAAGAVYLYLYRSPFPCVFHELTGLYCPGCGAGRAAYSILHLDLLRALGFNALFVLATPFLAYYFLKIYLKIVTGRDLLPLFRVTVRQYSIAVLIILVFTILRNIPVFPFSLLAPGSLFA